MRRFTGTELGMLALAGLLFIVGAVSVFHPTEMNLAYRAYRRMPATIEHVSKRGSQAYGVLAIALGAGLAWLVFAGRRK
jgi:hypothetical protein